jgi:hypothetical protein
MEIVLVPLIATRVPLIMSIPPAPPSTHSAPSAAATYPSHRRGPGYEAEYGIARVCARVCECARVRACVRARARACMRVFAFVGVTGCADEVVELLLEPHVRGYVARLPARPARRVPLRGMARPMRRGCSIYRTHV